MAGEKEAGRLFVLPVDASDNSKRAFNYFMRDVYRPGDRLDLVHVHEPPSLPSTYVMMGPMVMPTDWDNELQTSMQKSRETLEEYKKLCESKNVPAELHMPSSEFGAGEAICKLAKEKNANGIFMGSRGLNFIRRTLLGSVSSYVVNHSEVPVTVTPPSKEDVK